MFPRSTLRRSHLRGVQPRFPRPLLFSQTALDWAGERATRAADFFGRRRASEPASDLSIQEPTPAENQAARMVRAATGRLANHRLVSEHRPWLLRVLAPTAVVVACFAIALQLGGYVYASVTGAVTAVVMAMIVVASMLF